MLLLRNLIYWLILVVSLIAMFPFILLAAIVPNGAHAVARQWVKILMWSLKNIVGLKYRLVGAENIPDKPSIICAKHQSGWETLALQEIFPPQVFVAKRELFKIPFFGWGLKIVKTIGIERGSAQANAQLAKQGRERRDEGYWITIFPKARGSHRAARDVTKAARRGWRSCLKWTSSPSPSTAVNFGRKIRF